MRLLHLSIALCLLMLAAWTSGATPREVDASRGQTSSASASQPAPALLATSAPITPSGAGWMVDASALNAVPEYGTLVLFGSALMLLARRLRRPVAAPRS